jgi:hypothetical protein
MRDIALLALISGSISIGVSVVVLVVVATMVRARRPDAYGGLLAWAIVGLLFNVFHRGFVTIAYPLFAHWSTDFDMLSVMSSLSFSIGSLVLFALLVRGLLLLSRPPRPQMETT